MTAKEVIVKVQSGTSSQHSLHVLGLGDIQHFETPDPKSLSFSMISNKHVQTHFQK